MSPPSRPLSPEQQQQVYLGWTGLVERACEEQDARLVAFYLRSAETQGLSAEEIKQRVLRRRPGDPLLVSSP